VKIPTDAMVSQIANPAINIETGHMCFLFRKIQIHLLSLELTTIMCFQKACVIMFPIWGKQHLRNRFSFTSVVVVFVCSVVYLPRFLEKLIYLHTGLDDICCFKFDRTFIKYIEYILL
jgi:hypothetical protein